MGPEEATKVTIRGAEGLNVVIRDDGLLPRPFWVMLDVFNVGIKFFFGTRHKKSIEKIIGEKVPEDVVGFSNGNIVWICDNATEGALVHELYHSTSWVLEHFGIKDEETGAYILAYLYKKSIGKFREWEKDGQTRSKVGITARSLQLLGGAERAPQGPESFEDDVPF